MADSAIPGCVGVGHELPHRQPPHLAGNAAIRMQGEITPARAGLVQGEAIGERLELDAGGGAGYQPHPLVHLVKLLMHMAEQDGLLLGMAGQHGEEIIGILEIVLIQPGAAHRHRLMVQGDEGVALGMLTQGAVQRRQLVIPEHTMGFAAHLGIEQDHLPVVSHQLLGFADPGGMEVLRHQGAVIVVAGQPVDGARQRGHHGGEPLIGFRAVILGQIPGGEDQIERMGVGLHLLQHGSQALCGSHGQQSSLGTGEEMGIGNL